MVAIGVKMVWTNFGSLFYTFPFMPHDDQKKCFDLFDRVEGELRKKIHVP